MFVFWWSGVRRWRWTAPLAMRTTDMPLRDVRLTKMDQLTRKFITQYGLSVEARSAENIAQGAN